MTTANERRLARMIEDQLNSDPTIQSVLAAITPRQPRYRYYETPDGTMFIYTTEKFSDGKYGSAVYKPYGPGSRSGKKKVTRWTPTREVHHATRKAAKARAARLWTAHEKAHPEWREQREQANRDRNEAVRLRYFQRTGRWSESWGPTPANT